MGTSNDKVSNIINFDLNTTIEIKKSLSLRFKKATIEDLSEVLKLSDKMLKFHNDLDPYYGIYSKYEDHGEYYREQLNKKNVLYLIVYNGNTAIALASASIVEMEGTDAPKIGHLVSNFVEDDYRGLGIGTRLLEYRMDWFRKNNVKHAEMSVDARNADALRLWQSKGFYPYQITLKIDL